MQSSQCHVYSKTMEEFRGAAFHQMMEENVPGIKWLLKKKNKTEQAYDIMIKLFAYFFKKHSI